jgi:MYXO-CTERM domain-containing protein
MRRSTIVSTLVLAGLIASPALLNAQTNPADERDTAAVTDTTMVAHEDDRGNWGWMGLLGLAGLIGLRRRERVEPRDQVRARQAV